MLVTLTPTVAENQYSIRGFAFSECHIYARGGMNMSGGDQGRGYRLWAIAAARLRSEGLTQLQIAARLQKSQPEVSRLLSYAEDNLILARAPGFLGQNVSSSELEEVERRFFVPGRLRKALQKRVPEGIRLEVRVLPGGREAFARAAAEAVVRLFRRSKLIGIMWGRTVQSVVAHLASRPDLFSDGAVRAQCIPLCGDPVHLMNVGLVKYSASHLAAELGQVISPERRSDQPCLAGVPAYLPRQIFIRQPESAATWEQFVQEIPGYRSIFGPAQTGRCWRDGVDTIITGMGIVPQEQSKGSAEKNRRDETGDFIRERLVQEEGLTQEQLASLVYGDIGGWLLEKSGLNATDRRFVESLNQGWTGIKGDQLALVAKLASVNDVPGVIVLAGGTAKADMALEIVRRGLANELLVDSQLAGALQAKLGLKQLE